MLPKHNRIVKKTEFQEVLHKGQTIQGKLFGLVVYDKSDNSPAKIGIIISKKISKLATRRNRARRLIKEVARELIKNLKPGLRFVFLAKRSIIDANLVEIREDIVKIFKNYQR